MTHSPQNSAEASHWGFLDPGLKAAGVVQYVDGGLNKYDR